MRFVLAVAALVVCNTPMVLGDDKKEEKVVNENGGLCDNCATANDIGQLGSTVSSISGSVFNSTLGFDDETPFESSMPEDSCSLYLAPSSIPNSGFGVFAAKTFKVGSIVLPSDAPGIVITDREYHQYDGEKPDPAWGHDNYVWSTVGRAAFEADETSLSAVTLGSMANYHSYLKSIRPYGITDYDDGILNRHKDPGAGAFSYHKAHDFVATRDIAAGEEVYADYGSDWFTQRGYDVPKEDNFKKADKLLDVMKKNLLESNGRGTLNENHIKLINSIVAMYDKHAASLLPETQTELVDAISDGESLAWRSVKKRSVTWIINNGRCLDNMVMQLSTTPQAGNGAFASRFLSGGSIIVPVPLVLIPNRDTLTIYGHTFDEYDQKVRDENTVVGTQIILNYCFGHSNSSMLLCPASNAVLINHCSTRQVVEGGCGTNGPNAEYRWASEWDPDTQERLQLPLRDLIEIGRGPSLEIYATRDITSGEEIFIDYGQEWEDAWHQHVQDWTAPEKGGGLEDYIPVTQMNERWQLRTVSEQNEDGDFIPSNVFQACIYWNEEVTEEEQATLDMWEGGAWDELSTEEMLHNFAYDGSEYIKSDETIDWIDYWPCRVFFRDDDERSTYTVRIYEVPRFDQRLWGGSELPLFLTNYPRESIEFFTKPYKSDQHLPKAFRYPIGIRNDIFPPQWNDRSPT